MSVRVLSAINGVTTEIGFYLAGMEEVREQVCESIAGLSDEQVGRPAFPGAHSLGALVLHIGESEWYWMQMVVAGHELSDDDRKAPCWDVLDQAEGFLARGYSGEFCLNEIKKIRDQTIQTLAAYTDSDLERIFSIERRGEKREQSLRWILHHLIDHEAQHKGQMLMLKRLMA